MPFGIIGRAGPGMMHVVWFGNRSTARGTFGDQLGARQCIQWGLYGVGLRVRRCLNHRSCDLGWCLRWAEALLYYMGVNVVQPEEDVLGVFVLHFHNGKCHWVAEGEMFPIHMRKRDNISVRQRTVEKLDSCAFWRYIRFQHPNRGL